MKPDPQFLRQPKSFWANVRAISQHAGYTAKGTKQIKIPALAEMAATMEELELTSSHIVAEGGRPTKLGKALVDYFNHRAQLLNQRVEPLLMNKETARALFEEQKARRRPGCPIPMNKQKGEKKAPAYFTAVINMLIEEGIEGHPCDYDPRELTTITRDGEPVRTLARRVDGAFPGPVNPVAIWEVKEYYHTTTFGSRVADGVYESLLDGMELEELRHSERIDVKHYLMVDDHFTWWDCGRSYLCRLIDMLHMRYVDEVLFGREILERLPVLAKEWVATARRRALSGWGRKDGGAAPPMR
jgi:hypothetical protein